MKRIASILTGLSLAVLFLVTSAHAQPRQRMIANIPFDFTVGGISLPAGQYEFLDTGGIIVEVRDADRHGVFTLSSASIQANDGPGKSMLKFATVDGHHVLVQIWNEFAGNGVELPYGHTSVESGAHTTVDETVSGRR